MFKRRNTNQNNNGLTEQLQTLKSAQDDIIFKMQTKKVYESEPASCGPVDFTKSTRIEYVNDIFMQDLSTDEQVKLGLNIFHVKIDKTTTSPIHDHEARSQLVYVRKGTIYDKVSKIRFGEGESFFISKRNKHSIKYMKGSEILFIYMPGLNLKSTPEDIN